MTEGPSKGDLMAAAREAVTSEREKAEARAAEARAAGRRTKWVVPVFGTGCVLLALLLILRPPQLGLGDPPTPPDPPAVQAANDRGVLVIVAARLRAYAKTNGSLPESLADLGGRLPTGVRYTRVDEQRFTLSTAGPAPLTLTSEDDPTAFLAGQFEILRQRGR